LHGRRLAFLAAARLSIDAAVCYYATRMENFLDERRRCDAQSCFISRQGFAIPPDAREKIRAGFNSYDDAECYVYADAGHAFNNDRRESFDPFAAQLARSRSIGFLRKALGPRYDLSALWDTHPPRSSTIATSMRPWRR